MKRTLWIKGLREIRQRWVQYLMLMLILAVGIGAYNSFHDLSDSRYDTFDVLTTKMRMMDAQVRFQHGVVANETDVRAIIEANPEVIAAEYRLAFDTFLNITSEGDAVTTKGRILGYHAFAADGVTDRTSDLTVNVPLFYEDGVPSFSSPTANETYLEYGYAKARGLDTGDTVKILFEGQQIDLNVLARVNIPSFLWPVEEGQLFPNFGSYGIMMVPYETALRIHGGNGTPVNDVVLHLADPDAVDAVNLALESDFNATGLPVDALKVRENTAYNAIISDIEGDEQFTPLLPIIVFIIAGFGLIMTLRRMVRSHRPQIGIFKALGVPDRTILFYFAIIGLLVGIGSIVLGFGLSLLMDLGYKAMMGDLMGLAVNTYIISPWWYLRSGIIAIVLSMGCTLIPAAFALRISPVEAIQKREGLARVKTGWFERLAGRIGGLPVSLKVALRNLVRNPGRNLTSIIGIALSLTLFLSMWFLMISIIDVFESDGGNNHWETEVTMVGFVAQNTSEAWAGQGIAWSNPGITLPTVVQEDGDTKGLFLYGMADPEQSFSFDYRSGGMTSGGIVIPQYVSDELGVDVGDTVIITVPKLIGPGMISVENVSMPISGVHSNHMGFYAFTDLATLQDLTNMSGMVNVYHLAADPGGYSDTLQYRLITTPGVNAVSELDDRFSLIQQYMGFILGMMGIMALTSAGLAAGIVYNLFMIQAEEKRRDYATMKTLGTTTGGIAKLISIEASILTVFGTLLGVAGGWGLALYLFVVIARDDVAVMNIALKFDPTGLLIGFVMIAVVVTGVSLITLRYIAKINIADVIRERTA